MASGGGAGLVVAAGTFDTGPHPRARVLIEGLRAHGWDVEEIVEPLRLSTAERVDILRRPALLPRLVAAVLRAWRTLVPRLVRRRRRAPRPAAVLVGHLGHFDAPLVRRLLRPAPVLLDFLVSGAGTAVDRGERGGLKLAALRALDEVALRSADVVLVDTAEHRGLLPARHRDRAVVVPVGADERWFAAGEAREPRVDEAGRLTVVFFGLFTPLQGTPVIAEALRELDGLVGATVVGTGQDEAAVDGVLASVPGVTRLPWVAPDELPGLVARHDVCLGIFGTADKARRVVPNKVFQGAAAGCAIVTSDTVPQRRALGDAAAYVEPGSATALAAALRGLAADPARLRRLADAASTAGRERFAPAAVVRPLVDVLAGLP